MSINTSRLGTAAIGSTFIVAQCVYTVQEPGIATCVDRDKWSTTVHILATAPLDKFIERYTGLSNPNGYCAEITLDTHTTDGIRYVIIEYSNYSL